MKTKAGTRTLEQLLQSTSDTLFPAELGKRRVKVNSRDVEGDTPLHVLVWRKDVSGVKMLIEAGAKPNAVGDMGETPLHIALRLDQYDIALALIEAGAVAGIRSEFNQTPLEIAKEKGGRFARLFR